MNNKYNERQYQLMANYIKQFEERKISLINLINVLKALLDCLEQPEQEWKKAFFHSWATLEEVYAVSVYQGCTILDSESQDIVEYSIKKIKELIAQQIKLETK